MKKSEIVKLCRDRGIRLTRGRGQNFLIDDRILEILAGLAVSAPEAVVIEIGAGFGNWTLHLSRKAKQVYAVEIDRRVFDALAENTASLANIEPVQADALKLEIRGFLKERSIEHAIIAGNLPYHVTTPVLFRLIDQYRARAPFEEAFFMVQKEVAERMTASVGDAEYSRLSVILAYYCCTRRLRTVPRQCFFPVPKVDSAFVSLDFTEGIRQRQEDDEWFEAVVRVAFSQRRKQLRNLLKGFPAQISTLSGQENREMSALKDIDWSELLEEAGVKPTDRAENVSPEKFLALSRRINHVFRAG